MTELHPVYIDMYHRGETVSKISQVAHISIPKLKRLLVMSGVKLRPKWTHALTQHKLDRINEIMRFVNLGMSYTEIGNRLGMTKQAVHCCIKQYGEKLSEDSLIERAVWPLFRI